MELGKLKAKTSAKTAKRNAPQPHAAAASGAAADGAAAHRARSLGTLCHSSFSFPPFSSRKSLARGSTLVYSTRSKVHVQRTHAYRLCGVEDTREPLDHHPFRERERQRREGEGGCARAHVTSRHENPQTLDCMSSTEKEKVQQTHPTTPLLLLLLLLRNCDKCLPSHVCFFLGIYDILRPETVQYTV